MHSLDLMQILQIVFYNILYIHSKWFNIILILSKSEFYYIYIICGWKAISINKCYLFLSRECKYDINNI